MTRWKVFLWVALLVILPKVAIADSNISNDGSFSIFVANWLPLVVLVAVWYWFLRRMVSNKKSGNLENDEKTLTDYVAIATSMRGTVWLGAVFGIWGILLSGQKFSLLELAPLLVFPYVIEKVAKTVLALCGQAEKIRRLETAVSALQKRLEEG